MATLKVLGGSFRGAPLANIVIYGTRQMKESVTVLYMATMQTCYNFSMSVVYSCGSANQFC